MEHPVPQHFHTKGNILRNTLFRNLLNMLRNGWFYNMYTPQKIHCGTPCSVTQSDPTPTYLARRCATTTLPHHRSCPLPPTTPTTTELHQSRTAPHRHLHPSRFCIAPPPPFHCSITSKTSRLNQSLHKG